MAGSLTVKLLLHGGSPGACFQIFDCYARTDEMSENREWDFVHSTCYLYIAFACETDGVFTDEEKTTIFQCVKEWVPDTDDDDIGAALKTASGWLIEDCQGNGDGNKITSTMGGIAAIARETLDPKARENLLKDLVRISVADLNFDAKEKEWIRYLAEVMEVDFKI